MKAIAMMSLYALTFRTPIFRPAAVKKSELTVHRNEVAIAAVSPSVSRFNPITTFAIATSHRGHLYASLERLPTVPALFDGRSFRVEVDIPLLNW